MQIPADGIGGIIQAKATKRIGKPVEAYKSSSATPSVEFSDVAMEFKGIKEISRNVPDVRMDKVNELKAQIQSGKYSVDVDRLADILTKYM